MGKILSIILAIIVIGSSAHYNAPQSDDTSYAADSSAQILTQSVAEAEQKLKKTFPEINFKFDPEIHGWYKYLLYEVLTTLPQKHVLNVKDMKIENSNLPVRGMMAFTLGNQDKAQVKLMFNSIKFPMETGLSCDTVAECLRVTDDRVNRSVLGVMVHEMGHAIDMGASTQGTRASGVNKKFKDGPNPFFNDDITANEFYPICYSSEKILNTKCSRNDFVSGYAKTDVFEDFAESTSAYILDGENFWKTAKEQKAQGSEALLKRYNFFKDKIFDGKEFRFEQGKFRNSFTTYDTTKRQFPVAEILFL
jgi:hypothetical protein